MESCKGKGNGRLVAPEGSRVVVQTTGEFCIVVRDGADKRTIGVLGPSKSGARRFEFMADGSVYRVVCEDDNVQWFADAKTIVDRSEPSDPVPVEVPTHLKTPPTMRDMVREEFLKLRQLREETGEAPDDIEELLDFDYDDSPDPEDPFSAYEIAELPFDEEIVYGNDQVGEQGAAQTESGSEGKQGNGEDGRDSEPDQQAAERSPGGVSAGEGRAG